jgi:hypothetical protein
MATTTATALVVLALAAYLVAGVVYADGHTLQIAGMTGMSAWMAYAGQVAGWPLMALMGG